LLQLAFFGGQAPCESAYLQGFLVFATELFSDPTEANRLIFASVGSRFVPQAHS